MRVHLRLRRRCRLLLLLLQAILSLLLLLLQRTSAVVVGEVATCGVQRGSGCHGVRWLSQTRSATSSTPQRIHRAPWIIKSLMTRWKEEPL